MIEIVVIGGGAAGMMAAITAARQGGQVTLLEPNERLGKKLNITGKGRCNVTNDCDQETLMANIPGNGRFLYSALTRFTPQDAMAFFEGLGVPLKVERGNRVFPVSDRSFDISGALERELRRLHVRWVRDRAREITVQDGHVTGVQGEKQHYPASAVVLATGGVSYPATGSTGDGLKWAADSGHRLTELSPALVPFEVKETETVKELQGLSLKNIEAAVYDGKKELYREFGEMLFTHFGVSGPVLLSASSFCAKAIRKRPLRLVIDLKPALSWEQLDERILRDFSDSRNKQFKNALNHLYPSKLIPVIIDRSSVDPDKKVNEITREERRGLAEATKALEFTLTGLRGYKEAIITQGGISVKDVNPSTMESKKIRGLYFAGEILDLDAVTGGFNLQIAWSTGWAAGKAAAS